MVWYNAQLTLRRMTVCVTFSVGLITATILFVLLKTLRSELAGHCIFHFQHAHQKSPPISNLFDHLRSRFARAVAGFGFDADQHRRIARLCSLQSRREFEAVRGDDAVV